ncbi:hypothetical protein MTR67_021983 [Solanum verrucosum]|uniref:Uncharacterized protein n=1 Tax=Solanum verrucosum TaxID=315347 RepID=A0AAF0TXD7_SOLVR|nr:hypothetical protein MTR67_021983 [Solanum verrucosum]
MLKSRMMDLHATFMKVVQQLREGVEIEEDGSSCHIYASCATTWCQNRGGGIFMPHLCKMCNNFVKVLKSRKMDLHAIFMQVVQQLGEGVEIEEISYPTIEVIASK